MTLEKAVLTIKHDVDGDGSTETGEFHMKTGLEITFEGRTGFIVDGRGSAVRSVLNDLLNEEDEKRKGFYGDLGGGQHAITIGWTGYEGSTLQWGDNSSKSLSETSATGQHPLAQINVFEKYWSTATIDSTNLATLAFGEYSSSGQYSPLNVVLEEPRLEWTPTDQEGNNDYSGSVTCLTAASLSEVYDSAERRTRG